MNKIATTRLSSKGQVVIPEAIRRGMGLEPGTEFVVVGEDGTVVLRVIEAPSMREFDEIVAKARKDARLAGLRESDIAEAIRALRSARRSS
ncbi:MAG: AbrB/MazE/SpoVT family DNA-binding domain-containing protein [Gammaproteobacteria bacterium]|nr:AbrB/MazE/SpoVT family DNA-binding domain-containing protein [Gammaproteobacteria bacterium]